MKTMPLFIVIFSDGSSYSGGADYFNTRWLGIPNKPIKRVFFRLLDNNCLTLQDYEQYNYLVEATKDWMKVGGNKVEKLNNEPRIEYIYFMGLKKGIVTSYRVTVFDGAPGKDKFRKGDITRREYKLGEEWYGKPSSGWK